MFKDELGGKIIKEFCAAKTTKTYTYLMEDNSEMKHKGVERCVKLKE